MSGVLYLIPNTLGDGDSAALADVLPEPVRARAAALQYYIGENAKTTRAFLKKVGTERPIQEIEIRELNVNTPPGEVDKLLKPILAGTDAGLVSEAGCPAVADPGALLVRRAHERGVKVVPFVGPSSILLALMASGMNGQSFAFNGYLPVDATERGKRLRDLEQLSRKANQTQIFIETPYRNNQLVGSILSTCRPGTRFCIAAKTPCSARRSRPPRGVPPRRSGGSSATRGPSPRRGRPSGSTSRRTGTRFSRS